MAKKSADRSRLVRYSVSIVLLAVVIYVSLSNTQKLRMSFRVLHHANLLYVVLAVVLLVVTFFLAASIYQLLALHNLRYSQTATIEVAASALNRTLPAGLGGLGLHGVYLYKHKHTVPQATAVVSVNNLIGITAHVMLLVVVTLLWPSVFQKLHTHIKGFQVGLVILVVVIMLLISVVIPAIRIRLVSFAQNLFKSLQTYLRQPQKLIAAALLAMLLTISYTAILYVCCQALHLQVAAITCFIIFSIGMLVGTVTPTPGGLVGAEAGLFAGFTSYGLQAENALAATLLFRLVTYWLPLVPGAIAFFIARKRKLV